LKAPAYSKLEIKKAHEYGEEKLDTSRALPSEKRDEKAK